MEIVKGVLASAETYVHVVPVSRPGFVVAKVGGTVHHHVHHRVARDVDSGMAAMETVPAPTTSGPTVPVAR